MSETTFVPSGIGPKFGIVGNVVAPAEDKFDGKFTEIRLAINHGYKKDGVWTETSTTFLTYSASGDYAAPLKSAAVGDRVQISGDWSLETNEFDRKDGSKGVGVTARYGQFEVVDRKADRAASSGESFTPTGTGGGF